MVNGRPDFRRVFTFYNSEARNISPLPVFHYHNLPDVVGISTLRLPWPVVIIIGSFMIMLSCPATSVF